MAGGNGKRPGDVNVYSPNLVRAADGGILLLFMRQHDAKPRSSTLQAWRSLDEGRTWEHVRSIEDDPSRAFSNPGNRFTSAGTAIVTYWTCAYRPDWRICRASSVCGPP